MVTGKVAAEYKDFVGSQCVDAVGCVFHIQFFDASEQGASLYSEPGLYFFVCDLYDSHLGKRWAFWLFVGGVVAGVVLVVFGPGVEGFDSLEIVLLDSG